MLRAGTVSQCWSIRAYEEVTRKTDRTTQACRLCELGLVCRLVRLATTAHMDGPEASRDILDKNKTLPKDGLKAVRWLFSETAGQSETSPHSRQPLMSYPA